jgi:hypothetical protein
MILLWFACLAAYALCLLLTIGFGLWNSGHSGVGFSG